MNLILATSPFLSNQTPKTEKEDQRFVFLLLKIMRINLPYRVPISVSYLKSRCIDEFFYTFIFHIKSRSKYTSKNIFMIIIWVNFDGILRITLPYLWFHYSVISGNDNPCTYFRVSNTEQYNYTTWRMVYEFGLKLPIHSQYLLFLWKIQENL